MTRLLTVSSIMVLIVGLMFGATFYAKDTKNSLEVHIKAAIEACQSEDKEGLINASNAMSELLKKRHGVLSLYVRHDETEKLETHNVILSSYAKLGSFESAEVCLAQISFVANHIYQRESLSIDNIF